MSLPSLSTATLPLDAGTVTQAYLSLSTVTVEALEHCHSSGTRALSQLRHLSIVTVQALEHCHLLRH